MEEPEVAMPKRKPDPDGAKQQAIKEIAGLVAAFCREHLNEEYAELCRKLIEYEDQRLGNVPTSVSADRG